MCNQPAQAGDFCSSCYKSLEERVGRPSDSSPKPPRDWRFFKWGVIIAALSVASLQAPKMVSVFAPPKPVHLGSAATDRTADQCLRQLWTVSKLLQERRWPGLELTCPATGRPYLTEGKDGAMTVSCPEPKAHRLSVLQVSRRQPVPEARS
jgi:hypothetical protein